MLNQDRGQVTEIIGKVYLVGAGPGDPGLLTIKGKILLESADVVVYDALVSPEIIATIAPHAEKIDAGKRMGRHSLLQQQTTDLLIEKARQQAIIVRLKGGDPFIFGRGGEEMEDLITVLQLLLSPDMKWLANTVLGSIGGRSLIVLRQL